MLEENATSRRARVPDRGTHKPGAARSAAGGGRGHRKARTRLRRPRRGGGTPPHARRSAARRRGRAARLSRFLALPRAFRIACHPRRLAARGRHPPGPGPTPAPAPRATLTDPCGSRGRSAVTQPASAGKAPSFGAENDGPRASGARALNAAAAAALAPSEAAPHLRREASRRGGRPCPNTGRRRGSPGTGERGGAGPPGALSDATRTASSIGRKTANSVACGRVCGSNVRERCSRRPEHRPWQEPTRRGASPTCPGNASAGAACG